MGRGAHTPRDTPPTTEERRGASVVSSCVSPPPHPLDFQIGRFGGCLGRRAGVGLGMVGGSADPQI
jgi:hypothetical protein